MTTPSMTEHDVQAVEQLKDARAKIRAELSKVIIGQNDVVDQTLISIFTKSHSLLIGVPGLAKTLLVSSLAETLKLDFKRIQFTPSPYWIHDPMLGRPLMVVPVFMSVLAGS